MPVIVDRFHGIDQENEICPARVTRRLRFLVRGARCFRGVLHAHGISLRSGKTKHKDEAAISPNPGASARPTRPGWPPKPRIITVYVLQHGRKKADYDGTDDDAINMIAPRIPAWSEPMRARRTIPSIQVVTP